MNRQQQRASQATKRSPSKALPLYIGHRGCVPILNKNHQTGMSFEMNEGVKDAIGMKHANVTAVPVKA